MANNDIMDVKDQARLELTLTTRENIINSMLKKGLPESPEDRDFLMKSLDGLDRTVLSKTKLKLEDKAAQGQQETTKLIGDILKRFSATKINSVREENVILDNSFTVTDPVAGEDHIGVSNMTYDEFTKSL